MTARLIDAWTHAPAVSAGKRMPAGAQRALALTRLVYGATLLARPDALIKFSSAHPADPHARLVARVLGARHCAQAVLVGSTRKAVAHELAAVVDLLHALSMAGLAAFDHKYRRAEIIDGSIATSLAAAQLAAVRRAG